MKLLYILNCSVQLCFVFTVIKQSYSNNPMRDYLDLFQIEDYLFLWFNFVILMILTK